MSGVAKVSTYVSKTTGTTTPNFLESEVGLVLKTMDISGQNATEFYGKYAVIPAGTLIGDTDGPVGILFESVVFPYNPDENVAGVTVAGSVLVAGRVLADRLEIEDATQTTLAAKGIVFVTAPETTR